MRAADLKKSILQMAVEGKLVEQDPADEPASALLDRIRAERARLIKDKKIKAPKGGESVIYRDGSSWYERRGKSDPVCIDDEIPFDIPESWEWCRGSELYQLLDGTKFDGKPWINMDARYLRGKGEAKFQNKGRYVPAGTKMILVDGENSGEVFAAPHEGCLGSTFKELWLSCAINPDYANRFLQLNQRLLRNSKTGSAIPHLNKALFFSLLVPLPPLAEQQRITDRLDELMPMVEEYGRLEDSREVLDATLPDRLRKSVLQMAVEGKLVAQDPADEPASALLERIREERAELIKQKKIKAPKGGESVIYREGGSWYERRGKSAPVCIDDEIPFEIPESWAWARLEDAYNFIDYRGKTPNKCASGVRLVTASNIRKGFIDYTREEYISEEEYEGRQSRGITKAGDILFTTEAPMGNCAINELEKCSCGQRVITFQNYYKEALDNRFFCQVILSPGFQEQIKSNATGTTAQGIKAARLKTLLLPVPPLAEQKQIIEVIDLLLLTIDRQGG